MDVSPVRSSPSLISMGKLFEAMTKVEIPDSLKMSEGRELANQQLMNAIPSKETRDFVLMNLVKADGGRLVVFHNIIRSLMNFRLIVRKS